MLPAILSQMGPENLADIQRFAYTGQQQKLAQMAGGLAGGPQKIDAGEEADSDDSDDEIPDLVNNFDEASKNEQPVAQ